jgi:hypothetical protein
MQENTVFKISYTYMLKEEEGIQDAKNNISSESWNRLWAPNHCTGRSGISLSLD